MHHVVDSDRWHPFPGVSIPLVDLPDFHVGPLTIRMDITLHILMLLIGAVVTFLVLRSATKQENGKPRNLFGHAVEAVVLFIRDEIAKKSIDEHEGEKWVPFLGTLFFFILVLNLMGLIPMFAGATANISVTAALSLMVFLVFNVAGIGHNGPIHYMKGIIPSGVPWPLLIVLGPLEVVSLCTRAVSLALRLFANMTAGHIMILAITGLISVFSALLPKFVTLAFVAPASVAFTVFILVIKVGVSFLQAYIFVLLSSLYIGGAIHQEH